MILAVMIEPLGLVNKSNSKGASEGEGIDGLSASKGWVIKQEIVVKQVPKIRASWRIKSVDCCSFQHIKLFT
jgi:hypothetical protein